VAGFHITEISYSFFTQIQSHSMRIWPSMRNTRSPINNHAAYLWDSPTTPMTCLTLLNCFRLIETTRFQFSFYQTLLCIEETQQDILSYTRFEQTPYTFKGTALAIIHDHVYFPGPAVLGSSASRKASPIRLKARTKSSKAIPG
jgi:hypothetical protein